MRTTYFGGVNAADERRPGTSECSLLTVAAETDGPLRGCSKLYAGEGILLRNLFRCSPNPHFFFAARPKKAAKSGYSTIQRLMGFNGVLTDGAGGSAQTDLSNLIGPTAS